MVKTLLQNSGLKTALEALGWISFLFGLAISNPFVSIPLLAVARVLP